MTKLTRPFGEYDESLRRRVLFRIVLAFLSLGCVSASSAADLEAARQQFLSGQYAEAAEVAATEVERGIWNERWPQLLIDCYLTTGKYNEAVDGI